MSNELVFILMVAFEILFIHFMANLRWKGLGFTVLLNMLLILFLAKKELNVFGLHSNVGNIFYAAVFYAMSICSSRHSFSETMKLVVAVFDCLAVTLGLSFLLSFLTSEPVGAEISITPQIVTAIFLAFFLGNSINVFFVSTVKSGELWQRKIIGNIFGQLIDSLVFFPLAFWGLLSAREIIMALLSGFIIKATLNVIDTIPFSIALKHYRNCDS